MDPATHSYSRYATAQRLMASRWCWLFLAGIALLATIPRLFYLNVPFVVIVN